MTFITLITFKGLNVNLRGKEHSAELTKKWTKIAAGGRKLPTHQNFSQ
jgi:hypothetical protein